MTADYTIPGDFEHATLTGYREATAAAQAGTRDVTWIESGGQVVAAIIPAQNYHPSAECCCKNCPWDGNHGEPEQEASE